MDDISESEEHLKAALMPSVGNMCCGSLHVCALTVQLQHRVVDLALDLPSALESAGHPQTLVSRHGSDDAVPHMG